MSGSKTRSTPASTITVEVDGIVMFWQISYGLPARVHVMLCPGAGIGGRLQVPAGAARGAFEGAAVAIKGVNDARSNTNVAPTISLCWSTEANTELPCRQE